MMDSIRGYQQGTQYTNNIAARKQEGLQQTGQPQQQFDPAQVEDRYEAGEENNPGIYDPKMFKNGQNEDVKGTEKTQKTGEVSLKQAQDEFFEVIKDAKENHGAKDILIEHFDKVKEANTQEGGTAGAAGKTGAAGGAEGAGKGGANGAGGMPPHIQVAQSLMSETRFPPDLQAKFKEKGTQLLKAWENESQGNQAVGQNPQLPQAQAVGQTKQAA